MARQPRDEATRYAQIAIGQRVAQARLDAGLSQTQLARRLGIHQSTINKIEAGRRAPSVFFVIEISRVCSVATDEVLGLVAGLPAV